MADPTCLDSLNDIPLIAPFDPTKKKKKRKNKVVIRHHIDGTPHSLVDKADVVSYHDEDDGEEEDAVVQQSRYPWEGSERDYQHKELLRRIFSFMHKNSPALAGDRHRTVLRPPQILSEGTAQTVWVNFMDLCKTMHRPPEHVKAFMLNELGTIGSLDGENGLTVKGRFAPTSFEDLLQRYINEYVRCNCCGSPDTILAKQSQNLLLQCELCATERSVAPITAGYGTRLGRRQIQNYLL